jgi:hypothetical protein
MDELEKNARELILAITEKTLRSLKDKGLLKEPSKLQMLSSSPEMMSLIKKLSAPKYDPCRKFRKGDKAKPRIINGRENQKMPLNVIFTVIGDEDEYGAVPVEYMSPSRGLLTSTTVHAVWLSLIAPVEELEPYIVRIVGAEGETEWHVEPRNNKLAFVAIYGDGHPYPKAAAEAERDRLNAEYRKGRND